MFCADAAFVLTGPLVEKRLDLVHHVLTVVPTGDVKVHVAVADVAIAAAAYNVFSQTSFHDLHAVCDRKCIIVGLAW